MFVTMSEERAPRRREVRGLLVVPLRGAAFASHLAQRAAPASFCGPRPSTDHVAVRYVGACTPAPMCCARETTAFRATAERATHSAKEKTFCC